jgi:hypothetical protein
MQRMGDRRARRAYSDLGGRTVYGPCSGHRVTHRMPARHGRRVRAVYDVLRRVGPAMHIVLFERKSKLVWAASPLPQNCLGGSVHLPFLGKPEDKCSPISIAGKQIEDSEKVDRQRYRSATLASVLRRSANGSTPPSLELRCAQLPAETRECRVMTRQRNTTRAETVSERMPSHIHKGPQK